MTPRQILQRALNHPTITITMADGTPNDERCRLCLPNAINEHRSNCDCWCHEARKFLQQPPENEPAITATHLKEAVERALAKQKEVYERYLAAETKETERWRQKAEELTKKQPS